MTWLLLGCSHRRAQIPDGWTDAQAESIRVIRGTPVTVRSCRGIGARHEGRFRTFACLAGARTRTDSTDTVAVVYELQPLGPYESTRRRYKLAHVRFIGGPGIP